jgi:hypothetical protein
MKEGLIINEYGSKRWYHNNELHNENGPAFEMPIHKYKAWYQHGKLHRVDGPAVEYGECDDDYRAWYYEGEKVYCYSQEEFEKFLRFKAFW